MALIGDDCHWFYTAVCRKGATCQYRHCEEALGSDVVCPSWMDAGCYLPHCPYRHAHVQGASQPWNEFGGFGVPQTIQPVRSSLVSVPIVGGNEPDGSTVPYATDEQYYDEQYDQGPYDDPYEDHVGPGQAAVIITPRHDELFPPQVKPVVVRIGSNEDSSESDESEPGRGNLTTIRRIDTGVMDDESPRLVVEKEKVEAGEEEAARPERQAVTRENMTERANEEVQDSSTEEEEQQEESESGEEEEEGGSEKNGSEGSVTSSEEESEASSGSARSAPPTTEERVEPVLDLFDDDDTAILGVVEQTPIRNRQNKEARRASRDERRQEKRERREERRRSRSPPSSRAEKRGRPVRPVARRTDDNVKERRTSPEKPATDEKKEPVDVMSLEEIMRQKALESMVERRKLKEQAEKTKQGDAGAKVPRSFTPDPVRNSPKRPDNSRPSERRRSPGRDRPFLSRARSPPRRWPPPPDGRWRTWARHDHPPTPADYPYDDRWRRYDNDRELRPTSERLPSDLRLSGDRQLGLLQAQSTLMEQMSHLAPGPSQLLSEKDLKRQQKILKKQLKQLSKALDTRSGSESRSSSLCSSYSDSSSTDTRRKRRRHKAKKLKRKKAKKSRRKSPEKNEENETEPGMESDYVEYDETPTRTPTPVASPQTSDAEPPKVLPRAKVVIQLDGDTKALNISGSELLPQTEVAKEEHTKVLPIRKIQLRKGGKAEETEEEDMKVRGAIAGRVAAKKADDEATKLLLQKIRENARNETRKVVMAGSASTAPKPVVRTQGSKVATLVPTKPATLPLPGRLVQMTGKKTVTARKTSPTEDDRPTVEADGSKRRIIRRVPAAVYVPPSASRRAAGDSLDSSDVRGQLDKMREDFKPEPLTASNDSETNAARRASAADIRTNAPAQPFPAKNFELGVKTFAEIMREKKERKAREIEEKHRLAEGGAPPPPSKPKLTRPSVLERLTLPRETRIRQTSSQPVASLATVAGTRTIQKYEDDWLDDPLLPAEGLIRENKRPRTPTSRLQVVKTLKRARTEPSRKLNSLDTGAPVKSKSQEVVPTRVERRTKPTNAVRPQRSEEELAEDLLLMDDSEDSVLVEVPAPEPRLPTPAPPTETKSAPVVKEDHTAKIPERSTSARKSDSHSELEEMARLLGDESYDAKRSRSPLAAVDDDDDDALLLELDQLLA